MKVKFEFGLPAFTGKSGNMVYCYSRFLGKYYARRNVYPRLTQENERIGSVSGNLFGLKPSEAYKNDLKNYLMRYRSLKRSNKNIFTWTSLYLKLMYSMAKADPGIDLRTLTREEIYQRDLPCISVKKAVEAGLLAKVLEWEGYVNLI
ncbi:MAG TPA: hypothetical protein PL124_12465 [Candidatus Cloacimonadota bacterium]|nr:hypothetical protein [Candidatus Cloacimonadota bacterium]